MIYIKCTRHTIRFQKAQAARRVYIKDIELSAQELRDHDQDTGLVPPISTQLNKVHYTIDFCQMVTLPHYARQMGQLYFVTGRKVHIFGVRIDGKPCQYNYLIDENQSIG